MDNSNICKCENENCLGSILLHEKELEIIEKIKNDMREKHGDVEFNLKRSPSSGEMFTKFYELHIIKNN